MKALVGAFNQEKALVGAFSVIVQPVVVPMEHYTALAELCDCEAMCGMTGTAASAEDWRADYREVHREAQARRGQLTAS